MNNEETTFLFMWVKNLCIDYSIPFKDEKSFHVNYDFIYEEDLIFNFFNHHFPKNSYIENNIVSNSNSPLSQNSKLEIIILNLGKFFEFFSFSSYKNFTTKLIDYLHLKETKLKIWKTFFTISLLEEFSYNKYIKLDETITNMTNSSALLANLCITNKNISRNLKLKNLLRSPFIFKSVVSIVHEILSDIEISINDFHNTLSCIFNEKNLNLNETEIYHYYEDEEYEKSHDNAENLFNPIHNSFYNCKITKNLNLNFQNVIIHTPLVSPNNSARQPSTPKKRQSCHTPNLSFLEDHKNEIIFNCERCEEIMNKNEDMKISFGNLLQTLSKKDEEIENLKNFNLIIINQKKELETIIRNNEKLLNMYSKQVRALDEINLRNDELQNKIKSQQEIILKYKDKLNKLKDNKNLLKESYVKNEILRNECESLKSNLKASQNYHTNNLELYKSEIEIKIEKMKQKFESDVEIKNKTIYELEEKIKILKSFVDEKNNKLLFFNKILFQIRESLNKYKILAGGVVFIILFIFGVKF
jgi:hypothetical protein